MAKKNQNKKKRIRINVAVDKQSIKTRTDRANVIANVAPSSPIYKAQPLIQGAAANLAAASAALVAADGGVRTIEIELTAARAVREAKLSEFDACYDLYAASAEKDCATVEDVSTLGLLAGDRNVYDMAPPIAVSVVHDLVTGDITITVERPVGLRNCVVEISTDPIGPATWKRLEGIGSVQVVSGYPPGTYWVHAAMTRASEQSEFSVPVAVIVK